ncbi:MAG: RNA methyltransferase [Clostridiales bacterium]|nr:RNA methyltransferase [Clostridiales bacterium]
MIEITSHQNKWIKLAKSLATKKYREKEQKFLLEGLRTVTLAIETGQKCHAILVSSDVSTHIEMTFEFDEIAQVYSVETALFKEISHTENSQGVIGIMSIPDKMSDEGFLEMLKEEEITSLIMLDRLQDPGNMGTVIRTADAAGFSYVILNKGCVDVYNDKVVRSTVGSILNVRFVETEQPLALINKLKSLGYNIVVTSLKDSKDYKEDDNYSEKNCLVIGNEANGVSEELIGVADVCVKIPIFGKAESLNAAVAAGIMMYRIAEKSSSR